MNGRNELSTITVPVITWAKLVDQKPRAVGMWECMATGILWLWGEDEEG